ncbi:hypothetical protein [Secundilactobacillus folii]|uniref:Uncharacterized protein n=1 Tax=Secundilactobacillus folii TaxID=2678357 RepID=A0A7X2XW75_9LACO|nr:hypothetical protein [Secundilactobacillus folii]MTV82048.1 hypothetical protein [Secundilactobacillus folii]
MTEADLELLKPLFETYNIHVLSQGTMVTKVNDHDAQLDAKGYMPDQLIQVVLEIISTDLRAEWFKRKHG